MFAMLMLAGAGAAEPRAPTLQTHTGPWYQPGAAFVERLWKPGQPGQRLHLRGRVLDTRGAALADALIELWHTDAAGNYPPLRASRQSDAHGRFGIVTVLPGHNQGYRARHIHFVVSHPGHARLVTRIYFKGDVNMDEAPYPELAVFVEESEIDGQSVLFAEVEFVLAEDSSGTLDN
jgi:hydroxyquinol 1,2-dioxygenase